MMEIDDSPHVEDASALAFYLSPTPRCLWSKRDFALSAWDGTTIAVVQDVQALLVALADEGWPPFPLVNLLLLAMNAQGKEWLLFDKHCKAELSQFFGKQAGEAAEELARIHHLARERFTSPERRREVLAAVVRIALGGIGDLSSARARRCLKVWDEGLALVPRLALQFTPAARIEGVRRFTQAFVLGLKEVHADSIDALVLDEKTLLAEPPPPIPLALLAQRLARDLRGHDDLNDAADAARRLTGVLRLRRPFEQQDDVPVGGASDLARKGDFQNLLLSEWAQDDALFLARVAHQEALFWKPDSPPSKPGAQRLILVDAGLRSWGKMRLWLWGAALAVAAETPHDLETRVLAVHSPRWNEVDFRGVEPFAESTRTLSSELHPGACLATLLNLETAPPWDGDVVLLLPADVASDLEFQRLLAPHLGRGRFHRVAVERDGRVRWSEHHLGGWKPQGSCLLEPAAAPQPKVLKTPVAAPPPASSDELPAVLRQRPFPLRIPSSGAARLRLHHPDHGLVEIASDSRVLWWDHVSRGPRELGLLPPGRIALASPFGDQAQNALFVVKSPDGKKLTTCLIDFEACTARLEEFPVELTPLRSISVHKSILYLASPPKFRMIDFSSADRPRRDFVTSGYEDFWCGGRFFALEIDGGMYGAGSLEWLDGAPNLHFYSTPKFTWRDQELKFLKIRAIYDLPGDPRGPLVVDEASNVRLRDGEEVVFEPIAAPPDSNRVPHLRSRLSDDRRRLILRSGRQVSVVHLMEGNRVERFADFDPMRLSTLYKAAAPSPQVQPLLNREFKRIAFNRQGTLRLGNHERMHVLGRRDLRFQAEHRVQPNPAVKEFGPLFEIPGHGRFSKAAWSDGSEVWLDSRRLLHFRSSDPNLKQATLVPASGHASAMWFEDLPTTGNDYYFLGKPNSDPAAVAAYFRAFAGRLPIEETLTLPIEGNLTLPSEPPTGPSAD